MKNKVSPEVTMQATKIAKGIQKPGQTKEQTKLIAQGIEKGITDYKKQQGKKLRELDKKRKLKVKHQKIQEDELSEKLPNQNTYQILPWIILALSWVGFIVYSVL